MRAHAALSLTLSLLVAGCGGAGVLSAEHATPAPLAAESQSAHRPAVLLVHGHNGSAGDWDVMMPWLVKEGFAPKAVTLNGGDWNIRDLADQIGVHVRALKRSSAQDKIDVLAHSLGGVATRTFIKFNAGDRHIRRLVTIGSPHHGLVYASPGRHLTIARMLTPRGQFMRELNRPDETPGSVTYTSIWSTGDYTQWVPFASGRLIGAFNYRTTETSHSGMLTDGRLFETIKRGLQRTSDEQPGEEERI